MLAIKCLTTKGKGWGRLVLTQCLQMRRESICALAAYHVQSPHSSFCLAMQHVYLYPQFLYPWCKRRPRGSLTLW